MAYFKFSFLLCLIFGSLFIPQVITAQETQSPKQIISTFRLKNLSQTMAFNLSPNCSRKSEGDANCDDNINQFDLSIWQVELNSQNNFKKSDFNNDGKIDLTDYTIWQKHNSDAVSPEPSPNASPISQIIPFLKKYLFHNPFTNPTYAEGPPEINSSQAIVQGNGVSTITNTNPDGTTNQIQLNNGDPLTNILFSTIGHTSSATVYIEEGDSITVLNQGGVEVTVVKKAQGSVIQSFKAPDGTIAAIQSWPTITSYQNNEPPIAVTLPSKDKKGRLTLNIQANGAGIVRQTDLNGTALLETQFKPNGVYLAHDFVRDITVEANTNIGFTNITMPNSLGATTTYHFYKGLLYDVLQQTKGYTYYLAKPLDESGDSWQFQTYGYDKKLAEKVVADPIAETGGNTPSPKAIWEQINTYKAVATDPNVVNFADGFTNASRSITSQITKGDSIYTINQATNPAVLGAKTKKGEVLAAQVGRNDKDGGPNDATTITWATPNGVVTVVVPDPTSQAVGAGNNGNIIVASPDGQTIKSNDPLTAEQRDAFARAAANNTLPADPTGIPALAGINIPGVTDTAPPVNNQPGVPPVVNRPEAPASSDPGPVAGPAVPTVSAPRSGPIGSSGYFSTVKDLGNGDFESTITRNGTTVASQHHNPGAGGSAWTDATSGVTSFTHNGHFTAVSTGGGSVTGIDHGGNLVSVGADRIGPDGLVMGGEPGNPAGRTPTDAEATAWAEGHQRNVAANGQAGSHEGFWVDGVYVAPGCFLAGTLISTPQGPKPIETLKPGDKVYSYNTTTHQKEISDFKALDINFMEEYLIINQKINTTTYHPFYKQVNNQLLTVKADQLKIGDLLVDENDQKIPITSIDRIPKKVTVYNLLNVSPNNNFYAEGILVHNYFHSTGGEGELVGEAGNLGLTTAPPPAPADEDTQGPGSDSLQTDQTVSNDIGGGNENLSNQPENNN